MLCGAGHQTDKMLMTSTQLIPLQENPGPKNNKKQLSGLVEEEYKLYESMSKSMSNEQDIVQHFCEPSNTLFLCVLWQMLLEKDEIQPTAYKVINLTLNKLIIFSRIYPINFCNRLKLLRIELF